MFAIFYYFNVGEVTSDQITEYAQRETMELKEIERWLGPNLSYDP